MLNNKSITSKVNVTELESSYIMNMIKGIYFELIKDKDLLEIKTTEEFKVLFPQEYKKIRGIALNYLLESKVNIQRDIVSNERSICHLNQRNLGLSEKVESLVKEIEMFLEDK